MSVPGPGHPPTGSSELKRACQAPSSGRCPVNITCKPFKDIMSTLQYTPSTSGLKVATSLLIPPRNSSCRRIHTRIPTIPSELEHAHKLNLSTMPLGGPGIRLRRQRSPTIDKYEPSASIFDLDQHAETATEASTASSHPDMDLHKMTAATMRRGATSSAVRKISTATQQRKVPGERCRRR